MHGQGIVDVTFVNLLRKAGSYLESNSGPLAQQPVPYHNNMPENLTTFMCTIALNVDM